MTDESRKKLEDAIEWLIDMRERWVQQGAPLSALAPLEQQIANLRTVLSKGE